MICKACKSPVEDLPCYGTRVLVCVYDSDSMTRDGFAICWAPPRKLSKATLDACRLKNPKVEMKLRICSRNLGEFGIIFLSSLLAVSGWWFCIPNATKNRDRRIYRRHYRIDGSNVRCRMDVIVQVPHCLEEHSCPPCLEDISYQGLESVRVQGVDSLTVQTKDTEQHRHSVLMIK